MAEQDLTPEQERRQAALRIMGMIADKNGIADRAWKEADDRFIGTAPDGREFWVSYAESAGQERVNA